MIFFPYGWLLDQKIHKLHLFVLSLTFLTRTDVFRRKVGRFCCHDYIVFPCFPIGKKWPPPPDDGSWWTLKNCRKIRHPGSAHLPRRIIWWSGMLWFLGWSLILLRRILGWFDWLIDWLVNFIECMIDWLIGSNGFLFSFHFRPADTPFEDGTFKLSIQFTEDYPSKAPLVRFVSKM